MNEKKIALAELAAINEERAKIIHKIATSKIQWISNTSNRSSKSQSHLSNETSTSAKNTKTGSSIMTNIS